MEFCINRFEHSVEIARDLGIPKADDAVSLILKPPLAYMIALCFLILIVMSAIRFDDEPLGRTEKIHEIGADRRLSSEMGALGWKLLESSPQRALMRRCVGA